jgi:tRNA modification GTPase
LLARRAELEAGLDFADEGVGLDAGALQAALGACAQRLARLRARAGQGAVLREGVRVVLAGAPNTGKSSLLNALAGREAAIVTPLPGTTRDVLRETVVVDGLTLHLADTAGLRATTDPIEQEGQRRARAELADAAHVLFVTEAAAPAAVPDALARRGAAITRILNKIDLAGAAPRLVEGSAGRADVWLSARTGAGLDLLAQRLTRAAGLTSGEAVYAARRRHLTALDAAAAALARARGEALPELIAEELHAAARALGEITGPEHPEALLGEIFGRFCIGK